MVFSTNLESRIVSASIWRYCRLWADIGAGGRADLRDRRRDLLFLVVRRNKGDDTEAGPVPQPLLRPPMDRTYAQTARAIAPNTVPALCVRRGASGTLGGSLSEATAGLRESELVAGLDPAHGGLAGAEL
jgi:hypothetical protein